MALQRSDSSTVLALHPAEKRMLDAIADWPGIGTDNLRRILDVKPPRFSKILRRLKDAGLVHRFHQDGNRLALSDRALGLLARRDRTSVSVARSRWSMGKPDTVKNRSWLDVPGKTHTPAAAP